MVNIKHQIHLVDQHRIQRALHDYQSLAPGFIQLHRASEEGRPSPEPSLMPGPQPTFVPKVVSINPNSKMQKKLQETKKKIRLLDFQAVKAKKILQRSMKPVKKPQSGTQSLQYGAGNAASMKDEPRF